MEDLNSMKKRADRYETDALAYFRLGDIPRWRSAQREANLLRQQVVRLMNDSVHFIQYYIQFWDITALFEDEVPLKEFMLSEGLITEVDGRVYFTPKAVSVRDSISVFV